MSESDQSEVNPDDDSEASYILDIRARVAVNHFKREVLGERHVPGKAQAMALFDALEYQARRLAPKRCSSQPGFNLLGWLGMRLTTRAWESWFGAKAVAPRPSKQRALNTVAANLIRWHRPSDGAKLAMPEDFYSSLISGGLLRTMLAKTEAIEPTADLIRARAKSYQPKSAWHLHLDALEVRAFSNDFLCIPWSEVVLVASNRILDALHRLWRPVDGQIYSLLSSNTRLNWTKSSQEDRAQLRAAFARFKPDLFEASMVAGVEPSWSIIGFGPDTPAVHVHRLLFAIGADAEFLQGDRLSAWALDLATAGLAAHARAWTDRYRQLGRYVTDELLYFAAIDALLFTDASGKAANSDNRLSIYLAEIDRELAAAMACTPTNWSHAGDSMLLKARETYSAELADLGLSIREVQQLSRRVRRKHPLKYLKGG